jgi:hypothetical protein
MTSARFGLQLAVSSIRTFTCLLGLCAIAWGGYFLPQLRQQGSLHHIVAEYLSGQDFKDQVFLQETQQIATGERSSFCNPIELRNAVILRLAILNDARATGDRTLIGAADGLLYDRTRRALACVPSDSFAWLTLFWLDAAKQGLTPADLDYLRLSYALGPNEEWIALWRNQLAMAAFARLPSDLANDALNEFIKLVDAGNLYQQTATIFASASPSLQNRITLRLKDAKAISRENLGRLLYDKGINVDIPGVEKPTRPWQ